MRIKFNKIDTLTKDSSDFTLWKDKVKNECNANGCLFIIDSKAKPVQQPSERESESLNVKVRNFIIQHLDGFFHRQVMNIESAKEMLEKLQLIAQPQTRATEYALHRQFGDLSYNSREESVTDFTARFDNLVEKLQRCPNVRMSDDEMRRGFLMAIESECPNVYMRDLASEKGLSLNELKSLMIEEEHQAKEVRRREEVKESTAMSSKAKGNNNKPRAQSQEELTCYRCGKYGHRANACTAPEGNRWCYNCRRYTNNHVSKTYPVPGLQKNRGRGMTVNMKVKRPLHRPSEAKVTKAQDERRSERTQSSRPLHKRTLQRVPLKRAGYLAERRAKRGRAQLVIFDSDDEETVLIDANDLTSDEENYIMYAHYDEEKYSQNDDDDEDEAKTFYSKYESQYINSISMIIDTGAMEHMVNSKQYFVNLQKLDKVRTIVCANKDKQANLVIEYCGDIVIQDDNNKIGRLKDVLYTPTYK